jgi:hypothetical protein
VLVLSPPRPGVALGGDPACSHRLHSIAANPNKTRFGVGDYSCLKLLARSELDYRCTGRSRGGALT